jgi:hypothetical protein
MLHTQSGHTKLSSYLSTKVSKEVGKEIHINIQKMHLTPTYLDTTLMVEDKLQVKIVGSRSLFGLYDIGYEIIGEGIDINGTVKGEREDFLLVGKGALMMGMIDFSLHHQNRAQRDIMIDARQVDAAKLMLFLNQKPLLAGRFSLHADIPLYREYDKNGLLDISLHHGGVYLENVKSRFGVVLPSDFMVLADMHIVLASGEDTFEGKIKSSLGDVNLTQGRYIEANDKLNVHYMLAIPELSKLSFITKKYFSGRFHAKGEVEYIGGALRFDGKSNSLDGILTYYFEKGKLEAKLQEASLSKVFEILHYPPIMIGTVHSDINYDIEANIALINMESMDASFANSSAVKKIKEASGVDLSQELFDRTYFAASVEDGIVSYDFKAQNKKGFLSLNDAKMDASKNTIMANFQMRLQEQELSGEISGSLKSPQVEIDIAKYIEFKAQKEIDGFFGRGVTESVKENIKGLNAKKVKRFLKSFF